MALSQVVRGGYTVGLRRCFHKSLSTSPTCRGGQNEEVIVEDVNATRVITVNRPKALNALNLAMIQTMHSAIKDASAKDLPTKLKLIVVKGAGDKAFCAGGDVVAVSKSYKEGTSVCKEFFREEYALNYLIGKAPIPYVALIDGITMGGGCGISINGRFRVATERTLLAMPETALGLFPDVGATHFLTKLRGKLGLFLALTGYRLRGADVWHSGMATHFVNCRVNLQTGGGGHFQLVKVNSQDLSSVASALTELHSPSEDSVDELLKGFHPDRISPFSLESHLGVIDKCFSGDTLEEIFARLESGGDEFGLTQLSELKKMVCSRGIFVRLDSHSTVQFQSPTSLKVTLRQLTKGQSMKFAEVFPMEYRLTQRFLQEKDFHEGVRAILIDKDRNPKWDPPRVDEVSEEKVAWYFSPLEDKDDELI